MSIADIIKQLAKTGNPLGCIVCKVTAVDKSARTVDVEPVNEEAPILACNLQADQKATVGIVQYPRIGSFVVVGFSSDGAAGMVLLCEDVESVEIVIKDKDTSSIVMTEDGIVMNNGTLDGLMMDESSGLHVKNTQRQGEDAFGQRTARRLHWDCCLPPDTVSAGLLDVRGCGVCAGGQVRAAPEV